MTVSAGPKHSSRLPAWFTPALVAALGLAVSVLAFASVEFINRVQKIGEFEERAARRAELLQGAINVHVTLLRSIAGLFAASDVVSREEFGTFIANQPLAKFGDARLYWIPRVPAAQRTSVEASARADGFADFHIWPAPSNAAGDASGDSYPVLYIEPLQENVQVLGHDFGTDPERRHLLERARDSGEPAVTGRTTAIPESSEDLAVVIAMPIYKSKSIPENIAARRLDIAGFAAGTFRLRNLINASIQSDRAFGQDIYLYDDSAIAPEPRLLYFSPARLRSRPVEASGEGKVRADYHWTGTVDAPGRKWSVVFRPAPDYFSPWRDGLAWGAFFVGVVLTSLVVAYEWSRTVHTRRIERLASDLTVSHRRLEDEIAEREDAEAKLRHAQKVEAIGQLTGGIAHDFNNLLTIILGNLELAGEKASANPALFGNIQSALNAAARGASLTQRLLAFARRQVLDPSILDINEVISSLSDLLRRALGESIEIELALAPHLWPTFADRNQIEAALLNLVINGRDAMPKGGRLAIETRNVVLGMGDASGNDDVVPGDYVMLAVTDTGCGMSDETLKQAIEPYFTTKEPGRGTGLGLSSIYGFARQSGGQLKLYSDLGRGTTARLYLPRVRPAEVDAGKAAGGSERGRPGDSVLVAEK